MLNDPLNATEVASILHIGRNAVYELAKSGALASYKAGRKILFSPKDVEAYLESTRNAASSSEDSNPTRANDAAGDLSQKTTHQKTEFLIAGQGIAADIFVDRLQISGFDAQRLPSESYDGLISLYKGRANAALIHMYDQRTNSYNIPYVQRLAPGLPVVVFRLIKRWQGFAVKQGNPKSISSWGALLRSETRLANRNIGSGARILLDEKLIAMEIPPWTVNGYDSEFATGLAAANAVAVGLADVAIIDEDIAAQIEGIDFVKMQPEWIDIAVRKDGSSRSLSRILKAFFDDAAFRREYSRIVRGDAESLGAVVYEC